MAKEIDEVVKALHTAYIKELLRKVEGGEASASDLNVARIVCKEHGVTAVPVNNGPVHRLMQNMPDLDDNEGFRSH